MVKGYKTRVKWLSRDLGFPPAHPPYITLPAPSNTHDSLVHVHLPVGLSSNVQVGQLPVVVLGVSATEH